MSCSCDSLVHGDKKVADFGTVREDDRDPHAGIAQTDEYSQAHANRTHATTQNVVGTGPYM